MSTDYWPFNSGLGADSFEDRWRKMGKWWLGDGPVSGELDGFLVFGNASGREVHVSAGRAWASGCGYEESAEQVVAIAANSSGSARIDRVVIRVDLTARTIATAILQGTPAGSPVPPVPTKSSSVWEISLAQVAVANGAATINAADVTDERPMQVPKDVQSRVAAADQTFTSDASVNDDDSLFAWLEPNARYEIEARIEYRAATGADFRWAWSMPTGAAGRHGAVVPDPTTPTTLVSLLDDLGTALIAGGTGTGAADWHQAVIRGYVLNGSTPGLLRFRWAQGSSDGSNTIRKASSRLRVERAA